MHTALKSIGILSLSLLGQHAWCLDKLVFSGIAEVQAVYNDAEDNWLDGGFSKTRYDNDSFPLRVGKLGLHADYHLTDTLWLRSLSLFYGDAGLEAALIESYFHYRPVPSGPLRLRARLGAFHLPVSLENKDPAWNSRYGTIPSVINAWVGEDLRTIGGEISLDWPGRFRQSAHGWKLSGAVFGYNDATGAILAHRGWAAHDRQNGLFSALPEPTLANGVRREVYPFYENDDHPGYYLAGEWNYMDRFSLQCFHYDNLTETGVARGGQTGWRTGFRQLAAEWKPARTWTLMGQAMIGNTRAVSPATGDVYDADFRAVYILVNRILDSHSFSARVEYFEVDDRNRTAAGTSDESGRALMLSWQYRYSPQLRFGAEWLLQDSNRRERLINTGHGSELTHQLLFTIQYRFHK